MVYTTAHLRQFAAQALQHLESQDALPEETEIPTGAQLQEILDVALYASVSEEEGHRSKFTIAFASSQAAGHGSWSVLNIW